jgi:hypothetical protein
VGSRGRGFGVAELRPPFTAHESEDFVRAIRGSEKVLEKFSQKSIDTLLCVQLKGSPSPALAGSAAGELTTGKNKKSGK